MEEAKRTGSSSRISGREKVLKRKEGSLVEVLGLVKEAKRTRSSSDYRVAMRAAICFFGIRRLADIQHVRAQD